MKSIRNLAIVFSFLFIGGVFSTIQAQAKYQAPTTVDLDCEHCETVRNNFGFDKASKLWWFKTQCLNIIIIPAPENWEECIERFPDRFGGGTPYYSGDIVVPTRINSFQITQIDPLAWSLNRATGEDYNPYLTSVTFKGNGRLVSGLGEYFIHKITGNVMITDSHHGEYKNLPNLKYVHLESWGDNIQHHGIEVDNTTTGINVVGGTKLIVRNEIYNDMIYYPDLYNTIEVWGSVCGKWSEGWNRFLVKNIFTYTIDKELNNVTYAYLDNNQNVEKTLPYIEDNLYNDVMNIFNNMISTETTNSNNLSGYFANANTLILDNVEVNSIVSIYSISGILLNTIEATESNVVINGNFGNNQLYIVKNNNNCLKIK